MCFLTGYFYTAGIHFISNSNFIVRIDLVTYWNAHTGFLFFHEFPFVETQKSQPLSVFETKMARIWLRKANYIF